MDQSYKRDYSIFGLFIFFKTQNMILLEYI